MSATEAARALQIRENSLILVNHNTKNESTSRVTNTGGLLDIAIEIAEKRRDIIRRMRVALLNRDDIEALNYARQLCGVEL